MKVSAFTPAAADALGRCDAAGVVLDFVRFERDDGDPQGRTFHQRAACAAVAETYRAWASTIDENTVAVLGRWGTRRLRRRVERRHAHVERFDADTLGGRRIAVPEFFGPGFTGGALDSLVEWSGSHVPPEPFGFAYAFCSPPYTLRISYAELEELFLDVVHHALGDPDEHAEIWSWDTEWSPYFDAGREWWGTGLWTVDVDGAVVATLASATD